MMRLTTIALFASIMCPLSVFAATTQKIVSTNIVLEEVANQNDKDLEDVTLLSGLLKAKKVTDDLASLVYDLEQSYPADSGIAPTSDPGTEDTVTNSYFQYTYAQNKYLDDLVNKKTILALYGQESAIYDQLQKLNPAYTNYAGLVIGVLGDQAHKNEASEITAQGSGRIVTAAEEFRD